ncbi:MAG TPA: cell envelope biogenesis protein TolA [Sphingomonas sp.]|nr:cell envelope biogenesis protein TolA [Sphingomonas sp.]
MDRAEKTGLGIAIAAHVVLFGLLSVGFLATPNPMSLKSSPMDVALTDDIGLESTAPSTTPPAQSVAPDLGAPEDAAAPAPSEAAPQPLPPTPQPKAAPPPRPSEVAKPQPPKKAAPQKPDRAERTPPKREASPPAKKPSPAKSTGSDSKSTRDRPRGSRLGDDFLKGITDQASDSKSQTPSASSVSPQVLAGLEAAIRRQIQPCADRQVNPGPGANEIVTVLNLRLNRNGTLAAAPRVVRQDGVNSSNGRYARRVIDLGIAAFKGCSPLKLPQEYYQTSNGGWSNLNYHWQLR